MELAELERQLKEGNERERIYAAWALSSVSCSRTLEALINALEAEKDMLVAFFIASAIEKIDFFDERFAFKLQVIALKTELGAVRRSVEGFLNRMIEATDRRKLEILANCLKDAGEEQVSRVGLQSVRELTVNQTKRIVRNLEKRSA